NQDLVKVVVRQGEAERADENEFLGEFSLEGVREAPKMEPRIDVTFKIDANGILHVTAVDRDTGESQAVRIKDYMDKAAGDTAPTTEVQLAKDLENGPISAGAAATAEESGIFGRLKGMFGSKDGQPGVPMAPSATASVEDTTALADRSDAGDGTEVADRAVGAPADATDVADRTEAPPTSDNTDAGDLVAAEPGTDVAERAEGGGLGVDPALAADLKTSFDQLSADQGPDAPALASRGESVADSPLTDDGMMPLDDLPAPVPPGAGGPDSLGGDDDPFAVRERPQLDPFGVTGGAADPFGGDSGEATDPFGGGGVEHSRRTRAPGATDVLPVDFDPASSPTTDAASKKKPARLKIRYKKAATFVKEFTDNLEKGGALIKTDKPLECGRRCRFELMLPGSDEPVRVQGIVVWSSRGIDELPAGQAAGMGIRYDVEDTDGLAALQQAVENLTE
ncbi:MAG: Hsp70 family protein, partial [Myxococcota bacterium]|nr:Hsp70 family protein [Myxococcota bacterium]